MNLPHYHSAAMLVFQFAILATVASELTYILTASSWPPARWFRIKVRERFGTGDESAVTDFLTCPFCVGATLTFAVFAWAGYLLNVPLVWLQAVAAARIVGLVGSRFD